VEEKMKKYILLFILLSFCLCKTAIADFYKWEDEKGNTQITDYPPPENKSAKDVQIHKYQPEDPTDMQNTDNSTNNKSKKEPDVVLYTKNDCKDCDKARNFLNSQNIPFTEYNMDTDKNAVVKRKELDSGDDVPFAIINKYQVYGFSEATYGKALKKTP
jgi:glutaredoxin